MPTDEITAILDNTDAIIRSGNYDALPILNLPEEDEEYADLEAERDAFKAENAALEAERDALLADNPLPGTNMSTRIVTIEGQTLVVDDYQKEYDDCYSCGEDAPHHECPKSRVPCGHHCDCSWVHDGCCWCGATFGDDAEEEGGAEATPSPKIPTAAEVLARIAALEAENAALRQRIAKMESEGGEG